MTSLPCRVPASYRHRTIPPTFSSRLTRFETRFTVSSSFDSPCRARKWAWSGIKTSVAAHKAFKVRTLSDGGQSIKTKSNGSVSASSWSRRMTSRPTVPSSSSSAPARSMWLPQIDRFGADLAPDASPAAALRSRPRTAMDRSGPAAGPGAASRGPGDRGPAPASCVPAIASAAARFTAVVVLPTPPF